MEGGELFVVFECVAWVQIEEDVPVAGIEMEWNSKWWKSQWSKKNDLSALRRNAFEISFPLNTAVLTIRVRRGVASEVRLAGF